MLELENVSFSYDKNEVVSSVSLSVAGGQFMAVLGANGAGKSTLLRLASGLIVPRSGDVRIAGKNIEDYSVSALARIRAFLEQESSLAFDYRVLDAILLGRYVYGGFSAGKEDVRIAKSCMEEVGLSGFEERFYMSLSGGEKRRTMLARTLCQLARDGSYDNALLILDEPSAGLDPAHAHAALAAASALAKRGAAVVAVLHDPNLAVQYADKIALLKSGKLIGLYGALEAMRAEILSEVYDAKCKIISDYGMNYALFVK